MSESNLSESILSESILPESILPDSLIDLHSNSSTAATADLSTRADVHDLVVEFYREVVFDEVLEPVFGDVAEVDWAVHIPRLVDYWCRILLGEDCSIGPVTAVHRHLHGLEPIRVEHCDRWFGLWARCVDERFVGPTASRAKSHAGSLMSGMAKHVFGFEWVTSPS